MASFDLKKPIETPVNNGIDIEPPNDAENKRSPAQSPSKDDSIVNLGVMTLVKKHSAQKGVDNFYKYTATNNDFRKIIIEQNITNTSFENCTKVADCLGIEISRNRIRRNKQMHSLRTRIYYVLENTPEIETEHRRKKPSRITEPKSSTVTTRYALRSQPIETPINDGHGQDETEDEEDNDWIQLNGCGIVTKWRFPQTLRCPSHSCPLQFQSHSECKNHYKEAHARFMILCPEKGCNKPVCAERSKDFLKHYQKHHDGVKMPFEFEKRWTNEKMDAENPPRQTSINDLTEDEEDNDWIQLNGCGIVTKWRFPQTLRCPSQMCSLLFQSESECKNHYKEAHAHYMILCPETTCKIPVSAQAANDFRKHYRRHHDGVTMPYEFEKRWTNEKMDAENPPHQNGEKDKNNNDSGDEQEEKIHEKKPPNDAKDKRPPAQIPVANDCIDPINIIRSKRARTTTKRFGIDLEENQAEEETIEKRRKIATEPTSGPAKKESAVIKPAKIHEKEAIGQSDGAASGIEPAKIHENNLIESAEINFDNFDMFIPLSQ